MWTASCSMALMSLYCFPLLGGSGTRSWYRRHSQGHLVSPTGMWPLRSLRQAYGPQRLLTRVRCKCTDEDMLGGFSYPRRFMRPRRNLPQIPQCHGFNVTALTKQGFETHMNKTLSFFKRPFHPVKSKCRKKDMVENWTSFKRINY